jgi:hypothetical protein
MSVETRLINTVIDIVKTPLFAVVVALAVLAALGYLYVTGTFDLIGYVGGTISRALSAFRELFARLHKKDDYGEPYHTVVQDWKPTGYIDFSVPYNLRGASERQHEPGFFHLTVEEHRLIKTIGGAPAVERRWRRASLAEAREAAANYYIFLQEHPEKAVSDDPRKTLHATDYAALTRSREFVERTAIASIQGVIHSRSSREGSADTR